MTQDDDYWRIQAQDVLTSLHAAESDLARAESEIARLRDALTQQTESLLSERAARNRADAVVRAARVACARSLFLGRGPLVTAIAAYDDALQALEGRVE